MPVAKSASDKNPVNRVNQSEFRVLERQKEAKNPSKKGAHYPKLSQVAHPHIGAFNSLFSFGSGTGLLETAVNLIPHVSVFDGERAAPVSQRNKIEFWLSSPSVGKPVRSGGSKSLLKPMYPAECRERHTSYKADMNVKINWRVNGGMINSDTKSLGQIPIMIGSLKCNLDGKSPAELVEKHEDAETFGGYFVSNGIERLIRLLIVPRRNHPTSIFRPSFQNRGPTFSKYGVSIRSVRPDQTSQTLTLHYCTDGEIQLRFSYRKNEYMVPFLLVLRALEQTSDKEIYQRITMGDDSNTFLTDRLEMLLRSYKRFGFYDKDQALDYLGSKFAVMLDSSEDSTEREAGLEFLKRIVLVHLKTRKEKFDLLLFMLQKLYSNVSGEYGEDNPDSLQFQETLLGGHLILAIIKEKMFDWLAAIKQTINQDLRKTPSKVNFMDKKFLESVFRRTAGVADIGRKLEYFLATGNLVSNTGLDLQQTSGYTIIAEKLNFYRYIAHYRSIHRGSFFAELKTTTVRKLLPESWGFLCPVHTPDGSPCGLLNHLSHTCVIIVDNVEVSAIPGIVASLGAHQMIGLGPQTILRVGGEEDPGVVSAQEELANRDKSVVSIQLDGKLIGWCKVSVAKTIAMTLRDWKVKGLHNVPLELEIGFVPPSKGGQYPGLFLFSTPARMIRATRYLGTGTKDLVGPFEQVYMDIACMPADVVPGLTTHQEFNPTDMLSIIASWTPFSDFNQSPRNMYQCQMGKQTMGTPTQNFPNRTDNKMYRLQTGQTPVVRPEAHNDYGLDGYPNGMNAVVCVISYTGYDMEDASIISKSSHERGYGYGTILKGEWIDLTDYRRPGEPVAHFFGFSSEGAETPLSEDELEKALQFLDFDGLPLIGTRLTTGDPFYAFVDEATGKVTVKPYKGTEDAYVDQVRLAGPENINDPLQRIHVTLRVPRPPVIGDKFSSRHGQKGVISQKWPSVDMPYSESGIIPDVIINPHAFPSRMTIGMFIESIAGKSGALHGISQDATPFKFNEDHAASEFFGKQLAEAGFNYHGHEPMYSGITGEEFHADIYVGVVYYQRLRHMVSDKYQVRTTGPVHNLTQQPVKGRKRAGGIRLGEMERDSLLAHGVSFILQDRLMNCSDYSQCHACKKCGSILSPLQTPRTADSAVPSRGETVVCQICGSTDDIEIVAIPYVFRYLCTELVAMNVKLKLEIK